MQFDTPAGTNPIDQLKVIGQPKDRIEGRLKTTGTATYAYEWKDVPGKMAYGFIVGAAIAKGRIDNMDLQEARSAPGVLSVMTYANVPALGQGEFYIQKFFAAPDVEHYDQPVAVVVADSFEQARSAAALLKITYIETAGRFDLAAQLESAPNAPQAPFGGPPQTAVGDFDTAFANASFQVDEQYSTPDQAHAMMEPHATIASWDGVRLTCRTSIQQMNWGCRDLAKILSIARENIRLISPYIGGGFGGKGTVQSDLVFAALASKAVKRPVKIALQRSFMFNSTIHRPATIQRIRLGATPDGKLTAIGHESWSGNLVGGRTEPTTLSTRGLYAGANRMTQVRLAVLDLAEGNAMRAPGEAPGLMALEIAMDELAEKLKIDPVQLRIQNDSQVDPEDQRPFSTRPFIECLEIGAKRFGWDKRNVTPGAVREGQWLIGIGVASAIRGAPINKAGARARLDRHGIVTIETDMTDLGTGSYTIAAQTAAEMMGLPIENIVVRLGDSTFPETPGSGGQQGAASVTAGVYAACETLRNEVSKRLGLAPANAVFAGGFVSAKGISFPLAQAAADRDVAVEDFMTFDKLKKQYAQQTFGAHFAEVAVNSYTGEVRVRRMLAVCAAGRILNPKLARSQVVGGMVMGIGAALTEDMVVDKDRGFFVNHDLASYEVPVHADVGQLDVVFIDEVDPTMSPVKAKGVGELGLAGVAPAIANAIFNATGVRTRDYPITLDKMLDKLPELDA